MKTMLIGLKWLFVWGSMLSSLTLSGVAILSLAGCTDLSEKPESNREPAVSPAIAAPDGNDLQSDQTTTDNTDADKEKDAADNAANDSAEADSTTADEAKVAKQPKSIIGQTTAKVVDKMTFMQAYPQMKIVDNKLRGSDSLSIAVGAYVTEGAKASLFGMQSALKQLLVVTGRFPTYKEFVKMMRDHRVTFVELPANRVYAYDSKGGNIIVLEEPVK